MSGSNSVAAAPSDVRKVYDFPSQLKSILGLRP
jgi:hypothetical protein